MILVSLGTQDRSFKRLLDAIEKQIEIGNIKTRVVVQAGVTEYKSENMEIFDLIPSNDFLKLLDECELLICHGGVGTIIDGLKHHKKIIAAARLKEFGEHQNDHQKQIIQEFVSKDLILELSDFDDLDKKLREVKKFKPKEYESNTNHFIENLESYIHESVMDSRGNKFRKFMQYGFYAFFCIILEVLFAILFHGFGWSIFEIFFINSFLVFLYRFLMHTLFFREQKVNFKGEILFLLIYEFQLLMIYLYSSNFQDFFLCKLIGMSVLRFLLVYVFNIMFRVYDVE